MSPQRKRRIRWFLEARRTLALGFPIMAGMLGHMMLGIADTMMVGRVGTVELAGAALVNTVVHVPMVFGIGLLMAVQVLTSQAYGGRRPGDSAETFRHGLIVAVAAGVVTGGSMTLLGPYLEVLGQPADVVAVCQNYLRYFSWSMVPLLIAHTCKQFCEAVNDPWPATLILLGSVVLNIALNWVFIFGNLGAPAMGLDGAGLATLLSRIVMMVASLAYVVRGRREANWRPRQWWKRVSGQRLVEQLRLGLPVAFQHLMEVGAFAAGGLMMGWLGAEALAAHQVAISCAATTFMFALGIGMGVSIRAGHAWGAGLHSRIRRIVSGGLTMGVGAMGCFGLVFLFQGKVIAGWFLSDQAVIVLATKLLLVAAFFQLFDGTQVIMVSALRGISDVRIPLYVMIFSYWIISLPVAYVLAFEVGWGAVGNWIGLATGLATAAIGLSWRFYRRVRVAH